MTVRILGVVGLIAFIAFVPAHAQRRDSLKDARDDVEAAKKMPGKKAAGSPPSNPERRGGMPPTSSPTSQLPSDALPVTSHVSKADVYDSSNAKVGLIEDVLVGQDGLHSQRWRMVRGTREVYRRSFPSHGDQEEGRQRVGRSFHDEGRRAERATAEV